MTNEEVEAVLVGHQADLQVLTELLTALLVTHPKPQTVLADFQRRIESMARSAPAGTDPEEIVELRARAAQHLLAFELATRPTAGG